MVCIKFTAHPQSPIVSPKFVMMASDDAPEVSTEHRETYVEQLEDSLAEKQQVASAETASEQGAESDQESQSEGSGSSETASDDVERVKVGVVAALAGISYDFGLSTVMKTRIGSLYSYGHYFLKGHSRPP
jgi:hypothetical protein